MKVMMVDDHTGIFVEYSDCTYKRKQNKKHHAVFLISIVTLSACVGYCSHEFMLLTNLVLHGNSSQYVTQYLRGDTIGTWNPWHLAQNEAVTIDIVNEANLSQDKISVVKDAILSTQTVTIDDSVLHKGFEGNTSTYYEGWAGALRSIKQKTKYVIPTQFDFVDNNGRSGDITITLSNERIEGYTGYTRSVTEGNAILKSFIIIYDASNLSDQQLAAIVRHEFGHTIGLGHSTAPEDLMAPTIYMILPYISECDIDAIIGLYDGNQMGEIICQK
ncbi:matrixin family metalloprotease [Candidatus Nitrosotenuis cloacae]|nr:matrixin family metalloprotease [Candidatus Nitrosotenuis cloacae]